MDGPQGGVLLREIIRRNRGGEQLGIYSVCSAHPDVIAASVQQAIADDSILLIESTSSQVNQFGGYTGQAPAQFAAGVRSAARESGLTTGRLVLGGDHLGPYPWRNQPSDVAMRNASDLVRTCVLAGYEKIHLDASMACVGDGNSLPDETIAQRAAALCRVAEDAHEQLSKESPPLVYVIGAEVPVPGGETHAGEAPAVTAVDHLRRTLEVFHTAFDQQKLADAWERVIAIVVQPGVEFGESVVFAYDAKKGKPLAATLPAHPCMAYEAHSTDYQTRDALTEMVRDHFAILKVGPALTFAYREAIFALSAVEREIYEGKHGVVLSRVRETLDAAMLANPAFWRPYHHGKEDELRFARAFSYSDRCRYYWPDPAVQKEIERLLINLSGLPLSLALISQYLPSEYAAIRAERLQTEPRALIQHHVRNVLRDYASACGTLDCL